MHVKHGFAIINPLVHCLVIASYLRSQNDCILPGLGQHEVQPLTRTGLISELTCRIQPAGYLSSIRCQRAYGNIDSLQGVLFEFDDQNVSNQTIWNSTCRFMYRYTNTISPIAAEDIRRGF